MNKPRSRYEVIEKQGRLVVLVDGQPVEGFATRAPDAAGNLAGLASSQINAPRPIIAPTTTATSAPQPSSAHRSPTAASWLEQMGGLLLMRLAQGRDSGGRLIIERTIDHRPHRADLSADEERKLALHLGIWLIALGLVLVTLPALKLAAFIALLLLFKLGWPFAFRAVPPQRWARIS